MRWLEYKDQTKDKNKFSRELKKYKLYLKKNNFNTQEMIRGIIKEKWGVLTGTSENRIGSINPLTIELKRTA